MTSPVSPEAGPQPPAPLEEEVIALALATIERDAKKRKDLIKAIVGTGYRNGRTEHYRSPQGGKLGYVTRTDPEPSWQVVDHDAVIDALSRFPTCMETVWELAVPGVGMVALDEADELAKVLREHAPHMLCETQRVKASAIKDALRASQVDDKPAHPGIELVAPNGHMTVVPDAGAMGVLLKMIRTGRLDLSSVLALDPSAVEEAS